MISGNKVILVILPVYGQIRTILETNSGYQRKIFFTGSLFFSRGPRL